LIGEVLEEINKKIYNPSFKDTNFLIIRPHQKHIITAFELVRSFCPDEKAITSIIACPASIIDARMKPNDKFLLDFHVTPSSIYRLLCINPSIYALLI